MHKYKLTYDYMNAPVTKTGESTERIDAHTLLLDVLGMGPGGQILGTKSLEESLSLMRFTNVRVTWL